MLEWFVVWLLISNVALIPAIIAAIKLGLWLEAGHGVKMLFSSFFYHLCDSGIQCFGFRFRSWQVLDFSSAFETVFLVGLVLGKLHRAKIFLYVVFSQVILLLVLEGATNDINIKVAVSASLLVFALAHLVYFGRYLHTLDWPDAVAAGFLAAGALIVRVNEGGSNSKRYDIWHGIWHVLLFLAFYFVVESISRTRYLLFFTRNERSDRPVYT